MPGDGITDVAPLAQQQWNGRDAFKKPSSRLMEHQSKWNGWYLDSWIELVTPVQVAVTSQAQQHYLQLKQRPLPVQVLCQNNQEGWSLTPVNTDVQQQTVGAIQTHLNFTPYRRKELLRRYVLDEYIMSWLIDPVIAGSSASRFPAISTHGGESLWYFSLESQEHILGSGLAGVLYAPDMSYITQTSNLIGNTQITGGSFVLTA